MAYPKILIVEDDKTSSIMLKQMLEKHGYEIISSTDSGEEAIKIAGKLKPDLILMDIGLAGDKDGIETADEIFKNYTIPFLYLTVSTDDETIDRAKKTNPYGYIIKPYDKNMLYSAIEMAVYKFETEKKLKASEERNRHILSSIPDVMFTLDKNGFFASSIEEEIASRVWNAKISEKAVPQIIKAIAFNEEQILEYSMKKNGRPCHIEARIIPSASERVLIIVRDITSKRFAETELNNYKDSLEKLIQERTQEISNINRSLISEIEIRKNIEHSLNVFRHAINQNPNIVAIINNSGLIEYVNAKFTALTGYSPDEVIGMNVNNPANRVIPDAELWKNITASENWRGEINGRNKNNELYFLNAAVACIKDDDGAVSHFIISAEDITQRRQDSMTPPDKKRF